MRAVVAVLILGLGLTGCAVHNARVDEGYYASGGLVPDPMLQKRISDLERVQRQSASDFAHPHGIFW